MRLAIIGASTGQIPLCLKAKEMGFYTICFAWEKGAVCRDIVDKFYPISILEKERILNVCREESIDGVVSNASDITAAVVSYIATELHLPGNDFSAFRLIGNKESVRKITEDVEGLSKVKYERFFDQNLLSVKYPYIIKPVSGSAKNGVAYIDNKDDLMTYLKQYSTDELKHLLVEEYIEGKEISVESISFFGKHYVLQITDKKNCGAPHFVELSHHQPSLLPEVVQNRIKKVVPIILDKLGFTNGASHVELKVDEQGRLFLIEINPRGGGDFISEKLVEYSIGYDYIKGMICCALGCFEEPEILSNKCSGVYFLCEQSKYLLEVFKGKTDFPWLREKQFECSAVLNVATGNYDRNGYFIYQSDKRVVLESNKLDVCQRKD